VDLNLLESFLGLVYSRLFARRTGRGVFFLWSVFQNSLRSSSLALSNLARCTPISDFPARLM
jgi:hypothetical protein